MDTYNAGNAKPEETDRYTRISPMKKTIPSWILFISLIVLYFLHNDFWLWNNSSLVLGIPVGLFYHIVLCFAASLVMYIAVQYFWPKHLETPGEKEAE